MMIHQNQIYSINLDQKSTIFNNPAPKIRQINKGVFTSLNMEENDQLLQRFTNEADENNKATTVALDIRILSKFLRIVNKPAKEITKKIC